MKRLDTVLVEFSALPRRIFDPEVRHCLIVVPQSLEGVLDLLGQFCATQLGETTNLLP